ncbi:MAG: IS4 family transposase, partial [Albidovulum sp.]|nr:IS4 family transposase [Albidovulum sp.]
GDVFELFAARRDEGGPELLVRALRDRSLGPGGGKLFEALRESPERGRMDIPLERLSAQNSARGQSASPGRARRVASAALRWMEVDLQVPEKRRGGFGTRPCRMRAVHAFEDLPRAGAKPLEWMLLTTLPVETEAEAREILRWYRLRRRIKDWHRILKSGCKAEEVAFGTAARIKRAAAINAVIAWRLATLTHLGRRTPGLDAGLLFSEAELAALGDFAMIRRARPPDTLGDAMTLVAMLGGYLNRKGDRPPGHQLQWDGQIRLAQRAQVVEDMTALAGKSSVLKLVRSGKM